uniref:Uncharacterized protein n=1 Tax=Leersia perrieri TaxID=77586 RepID=A0A0D9X9X8_9ORYZ
MGQSGVVPAPTSSPEPASAEPSRRDARPDPPWEEPDLVGGGRSATGVARSGRRSAGNLRPAAATERRPAPPGRCQCASRHHVNALPHRDNSAAASSPHPLHRSGQPCPRQSGELPRRRRPC